MNFIVVAQPRAEFDAWVKEQQQPAATGQTGLAAAGRADDPHAGVRGLPHD